MYDKSMLNVRFFLYNTDIYFSLSIFRATTVTLSLLLFLFRSLKHFNTNKNANYRKRSPMQSVFDNRCKDAAVSASSSSSVINKVGITM